MVYRGRAHRKTEVNIANRKCVQNSRFSCLSDGVFVIKDFYLSQAINRLHTIWAWAQLLTICMIFEGLNGQPTDAEIAQEVCFKTKCTKGDLCYFAHPLKCNKFIMCSTNKVGDLYSQVMPCAFGTFWNSTEEACQRSQELNCPNDPCRDPGLRSYGHDDANCRTYWKCAGGQSSIAKCCKPYHSYDANLDTCVKNASCDQLCPILNEELCSGRGVQSLKFPDHNCKTYWNCTGSPHPVCCNDAMSFDIFSGRCVYNSSCVDACPGAYQDICSKRGVKSFNISYPNCRTYMKCNEKGHDDPYCCRSGQRYDPILLKCVEATSQKCKMETCPKGFIEDCHMLPVAGDITLYNNTLANKIMPCAVGTVFKNCGCEKDHSYSADSKVCALSIHAKPPQLKNFGKDMAALLMIGEYGQGERGRGKMSDRWDGTTGIHIPFFATQAPIKFFLQISFRPMEAKRVPQILVSSCHYLPNNIPTLELSLKQFYEQGGNLTLIMASPPGSFFQHDMPYKLHETYTYTMIYDHKKVASILEPHDRTLSPDTAFSAFTGPLTMSGSGLRFGHCRHEGGVDSFVGYVTEIQIAKCLTPGMRDRLYPITLP